MHRFLPASCALLFLVGSASATTVRPEEFTCPVCQKSFVGMVVGSTSHFGPTSRDFSDFINFACNRILICPYCLYSAFQSDFDPVPAEVRSRMKSVLVGMGGSLGAEVRSISPELLQSADEDVLGVLIAQRCYAAKSPSVTRDIHLLRYAHSRTKLPRDCPAHAYFRRELIGALVKATAAEEFKGVEKANMVYLLAELRRQQGQNDLALLGFEKARRLAPPHTREGDSLVAWCDEQSARIRAASRPALDLEPDLNVDLGALKRFDEVPVKPRIAMETLVGRTDAQAWSVLLRFAQHSPANLFYLLDSAWPVREHLRSYPPMWEWLKKQREVAARQVPMSTQASDADRIRDFLLDRLQEILEPSALDLDPDEQERQADQYMATLETDDLPVFSEWRDQSRVVTFWSIAIAKGDARAARLFLRWIDSLKEPLKWRYDIAQCLGGLSRSPSLWPLARKPCTTAPADNALVQECVAFACGSERAGQLLRERLRSAKEFDDRIDLIVECFEKMKRPDLKSDLLQIMAQSQAPVGFSAPGYVSVFGAPADLPKLEEVASTGSVYRRADIESAIRSIRLRVLLNPAASPAGTAPG